MLYNRSHRLWMHRRTQSLPWPSPSSLQMDVNATVPNGHSRFSLYNYTPTEWICALYVALFATSGLIHIGQAVRTRLWFMFPTVVLAVIGEVLGWSARLWSSKNVTLINPYLMQISATVIAPTPLVAGNFVILGELIRRMGRQYSRLSGKWYLIIFCSCDIIALVIQAIGGGKASQAVSNDGDPEPGSRIMLAGIVFQMIAITVYAAFASEFVVRYLYNRPVRKGYVTMSERNHIDTKTKLMLVGLLLSSVFIFIRSVYRTIELAGGWTGPVISKEVLFNVLEGAMVTLAMYTLNILHPGYLLGPRNTWKTQGGKNNDTESNTTVEAGHEPKQF